MNEEILLSLLHDIQGTPQDKAASTAMIAASGIKKDGFDKKDVNEIAANSVLDQMKNPLAKIQFTFGNHPELIKKISDWAGMDVTPIIQSDRLDIIQEMLYEYLEEHGIKTFGEGGQFESDLDIVPVKIGDKTYKLLYLYTEEEKERGLKDVEELEENEGAIFDYSDDPQNELSFWMKDTSIALQILFINKEGVVISTFDGEPLSEKQMVENSEPIYWVIEINQSENIPQGTYTDLALHDEPDVEPNEDEESDEDEHPEIKVNKLYIYGSDGQIQGVVESGARIFSRKSTRTIIRKAKRAYLSKSDKDYKSLGRYVFNEIKAQNNRPAEYVSESSKD